MKALTRSRFLRLACGALALAAVLPAAAQTAWPERPVKLVVPFAAGGATDVLGRLLASSLSDRLGQPVVVENRPGAGTVLAATLVAKAPADGYTLLLAANSTLTLNPVIRSNIGYDPLRDFTHLGTVADMSLLLLANIDTPLRSVADLVQQAKAAPERFSYGSYGAGSSSHFGGEMFKHAAGVQMVHVPFNGSAPSIAALIGGQVQVSVDSIVAGTPQIQAGKLRPLATLAAQRLPTLPQVPTLAESGYPGFEASSWLGLVGPAGLPPAVAQKIEQVLIEVLRAPELQVKLRALGLTPIPGNGAALRQRIQQELPAMRTVAERAGIRAD